MPKTNDTTKKRSPPNRSPKCKTEGCNRLRKARPVQKNGNKNGYNEYCSQCSEDMRSKGPRECKVLGCDRPRQPKPLRKNGTKQGYRDRCEQCSIEKKSIDSIADFTVKESSSPLAVPSHFGPVTISAFPTSPSQCSGCTQKVERKIPIDSSQKILQEQIINISDDFDSYKPIRDELDLRTPSCTDNAKRDALSTTSSSDYDQILREGPNSNYVSRVLLKLGLEKYIQSFEKQEFDEDSFRLLTESALIFMNVPLGPRIKILHFINENK